MKTILVPIDYSDNSQNVLSYALQIAKQARAEVFVFHAFYPIISPPASYNAADVILALEEGRAKVLTEFAEKTRWVLSKEDAIIKGEPSAFDEIQISCEARMGGSFEKILEAIELHQADLVVMSMQGGEAVSQAIFGSTTISLMQESIVPILAVPKGMPFQQFHSVVFATNLSRLNTATDLRFLRELSATIGSKLQVVHLYRNIEEKAASNTTEAMEILSSKLQGTDFSVTVDVQQDVAAGIQNFVREKQANLLVLLPQKHSFFERLLDKSITGKVTAHPLVPLLTLPSAILRHSNSINQEEQVAN